MHFGLAHLNCLITKTGLFSCLTVISTSFQQTNGFQSDCHNVNSSSVTSGLCSNRFMVEVRISVRFTNRHAVNFFQSTEFHSWLMYRMILGQFADRTIFGNSLDKLCHTRSVAYSAELVLLNKQQISVAELIQTVTQFLVAYSQIADLNLTLCFWNAFFNCSCLIKNSFHHWHHTFH